MSYVLAPWVPDFIGTALKTVIGPLSGALAGAMAAQSIAKRNAGVQRRIEEMRATNTAISTASAIVNLSAALKRQHVRGMKQTYDRVSDARDAFCANHDEGVFEFQADLQTLQPFRPAMPVLERLLYEKVNASPAVLALFVLLTQSATGVNDCIEERNRIVLWLKSRNGVPDKELAEIYFGLVDAQGHADSRYRDSLDGLVMNVDCTLLFSYALAQELMKHAERITADGKASKGFPAVARHGFQPMIDEGLFPSLDDSSIRTFKSLKVEIDLPRPPADAPLAGAEAAPQPGDPKV